MSDATLARRVIGLVEKLQSFIPLLAYQAGLSGWLIKLAYQAGLSSCEVFPLDHSLFLNKLHLTLIITLRMDTGWTQADIKN